MLLLLYTDCIGSAFNVKGAMQCPNCRKVERGQWLFASGSTSSLPEFVMDDWIPSDYALNYTEMVSTMPMLPPLFVCAPSVQYSWFLVLYRDLKHMGTCD